MSRARNVVQNMSCSSNTPRNPTKDDHIDMVQVQGTNHTNHAYENTLESTWQSHDYEDPSKMIPHPLLSRYSTRYKNNELYEPTGPLQARKAFMNSMEKHSHDVTETSDSCLNRLILALILTVSVTALVLVVLMITGFIGPSCLCTKQGPQRQSSSIVSIEPLVDEIEHMKRNMSLLTTNMINTKANELTTADKALQDSIAEINRTLTNKVESVSKMAGPMGPRGYNGTQGSRGNLGFNGTRGPLGPTGSNGSRGAPGPQGIRGAPGAGNLTLCEYKVKSEKATAGAWAINTVLITEPADQRIVGAFCHTDRAALVHMYNSESNGLRRYSCSCYGDSTYKLLASTMNCYISYWICPRET
ncbi:hypothetical protein QZH41_008318 [Actinostola sp. cb2023]|nr:hypothetical protein QZH41_008318 [Actinostola sp. cb2023]